jgi:hypothetical protein
MATPQTQNPQPAPQVDLSDSLVPKSPVAAGQSIDLSDSLVPKDSTQSTQQPDLGRFQGYSELGQGFIKGAKETARTVVGAADTAANWINQKLGTSELHAPTPFEGQDLEGKTPLESVGKGAESLTEFLLGDEALKGLTLVEQAKHLGDAGRILEKSPKLAKAVEIGANALRQGTVGGAQTLAHGGTAGDAALTGALTGGTGAIIEGTGLGVKAVKNFITRGAQTEEMGQSLVKSLTAGATPEQVARTVGKNLDAAEQAMHDAYDQGWQKISAQGKTVPVQISGSSVQQTAKALLSDSNLPESVAATLKNVVPGSEKIEPFLTLLANASEKTATGDVQALTFTWDQTEAMRRTIGETIRKLPYDNPIRLDFIKLRDAIDSTFEQAADKAGNSDLSDQIKSLRSNYAQSKTGLEESAITALREKNPNAVADILLGKQSVHDVNTLRRLIGPQNMKAVEGSILDKMIADASKNGELQGRQLFRRFNGLGPDAKQAIWGNRLPQIQQFMQQAGSLPNVVLDKIVKHYTAYAVGLGAPILFEAGRGDLKTAGTMAATGIGLAAILKNPAVLEYALRGMQGLQKTVPTVVSAAMQPDKPASQEGEPTAPKPQAANPPQNSQTATGPNGHQIYLSADGATWIDSTTGKPVGNANAEQ